MTKKQKEFIASAKLREHDVFTDFYIIDRGTKYDGFFGKNGFNNIVVIGLTEEGERELITDHSDVLNIFNINNVNLDIPERGVIHIWFHIPIRLADKPVLSSCMGYAHRGTV